jgi:soluble lytic murein transglycosylase-like protein
MRSSATDLRKQFDAAAEKGWLQYFECAAQQYAFDVALLLAIASRETNVRNIRGDWRDGAYHGYGLMQVDIQTDPEFCLAWTPEDVKGSVLRGAAILDSKRKYLAQKGITDLRAIAAAYNTGEGNVTRSVVAGLDPDRTTTGKDYGKDVVDRMKAFSRLLA